MAKSNWFYDTNGQTFGPVTVKQLRQLAANGMLQPTDRVRKEDMDRWVKAKAVIGLFTQDTPAAGEINSQPGAEPIEGDTIFDFLGNSPADAADMDQAEDFRPEFDFFSGAPSAPAPPRKPESSRENASAPRPPRVLKRAAVADDSPIRLAPTPIEEPEPPAEVTMADVPMAEVIEEDVSFALADGVPLAAPISEGEFGTRPDLSGPEVVLKPDGTAEMSGAKLALSLHNGWITARATTPDGDEQESYLRVDRIDAVKFRARPGAGDGKARVLSFHTGWQCVAVLCEDQDALAHAFVQLVVAGV